MRPAGSPGWCGSARQPQGARLLAAARLRLATPRRDRRGRYVADRPDADSYTLSLSPRAGAAGQRAWRRYRERAARRSKRSVLSCGRQLHRRGRSAVVWAARRRGLARARVQAAMPGAADVHLLTGDVLAAGGDHKAAAEEYRRAANLAFTETSALRLIGALGRAGDAAAADGVLQLFASQNPRNLSAQQMLAARALAAGQWEEAAARYERLRARLGQWRCRFAQQPRLGLCGGRGLRPCRGLCRGALGARAGQSGHGETLGWALYRSGDAAQGLALLQAAPARPRGRCEDRAAAGGRR
jgi:tetratricopeptide (TPR) repeat protein